VEPLVLMLMRWGRSLQGLRTLKADTALATWLKLDVYPAPMHSTTGCAARCGCWTSLWIVSTNVLPAIPPPTEFKLRIKSRGLVGSTRSTEHASHAVGGVFFLGFLASLFFRC
jgi:hypothetical protein